MRIGTLLVSLLLIGVRRILLYEDWNAACKPSVDTSIGRLQTA